MRAPLYTPAVAILFVVGCGASDEMRVANHLDDRVRLDVLAPREDLRGGCDQDFRTRFCAEEFAPIGLVDVSPGEDRFLTLSDPVSDAQCTRVLWLRLAWLGEVGPVPDPGTLIELPAVAEIESGAGRYHSVAFPQGTMRIDEVGPADSHQGGAPASCADLEREPR